MISMKNLEKHSDLSSDLSILNNQLNIGVVQIFANNEYRCILFSELIQRHPDALQIQISSKENFIPLSIQKIGYMIKNEQVSIKTSIQEAYKLI